MAAEDGRRGALAIGFDDRGDMRGAGFATIATLISGLTTTTVAVAQERPWLPDSLISRAGLDAFFAYDPDFAFGAPMRAFVDVGVNEAFFIGADVPLEACPPAPRVP